MAVTEQTPINSSTGNGVTTVFPYTFKIIADADLEVSVDGVVQTLNTDYTVSGAGEDAGGNVTFTTAPANLKTVVRRRNMAFTRSADYQYQGDLPNDVLNADQDAPVLMIQQLKEPVDRSIKAPLGDSISVLPDAASRANTYLAFDADGNPIASTGTGADAGLRSDLAADDGASLLGFIQAGTGTVVRSLESKSRDKISPEDFDAVGDGSANDHTALTNAFAGAVGRVLDGNGRTYKINDVISSTAENIIVRNMTLDFSGVADQPGSPDYILSFAGSQGAATALSADAAKGDYQLTVASTADFVADGYAWLASNTIFETTQGVVLGQIVKVKSVDSPTALTLYNKILYGFTTAASASVAPLTMKSNIRFENVKFIGTGANFQSVLNFDKCANVRVIGCEFEYCDYVACRISRCADFVADAGCRVRYARNSGTSYGFAVHNGSYSVTVANGYGEDLRHFVTVGDNDGVSLFVRVIGNHVTGCRDAGIDSHAACDFMTVIGNTIEGSAFDSGQLDGIIFQGLNWVCHGNTVVGARRYALFHQCLPRLGPGSSVIAGNTVRNGGGATGTEAAVYVSAEPGAGGEALDGVVIANNTINGTFNEAVSVFASTGNIKNLAITGNIGNEGVDTYGILLNAAAAYSIEDFTITGNVMQTSGVICLYLLGAAANILNGTITGNTLRGSSNIGIRYTHCANVTESNNIISAAVRKHLVDSSSTGIILDRRSSSIVTTIAATYTIAEQDEHVIANRAGTVTLTLPDASLWPGRELTIKTIQAQTVVSASSNVAPIGDTTAGTAILPATDGAWSRLKSDGSNWIVMQRGT